jgi:hypothetical protein
MTGFSPDHALIEAAERLRATSLRQLFADDAPR